MLLSVKDYQKLTSSTQSIVDLLAMPEDAVCDFDPPKIAKKLFHPESFD